jgi:hypothetical protein
MTWESRKVNLESLESLLEANAHVAPQPPIPPPGRYPASWDDRQLAGQRCSGNGTSREVDPVSAKKALLEAIQAEKGADDPVSCFAMADLLEEEGYPDLAFTYRWMGWKGRRPGYREGDRLRKRFVWYVKGAFEAWPSEEADRYNVLPVAWLHPLVFQAIGRGNPQMRLYATWEQAVDGLVAGLVRLRELLGPGDETEKGR